MTGKRQYPWLHGWVVCQEAKKSEPAIYDTDSLAWIYSELRLIDLHDPTIFLFRIAWRRGNSWKQFDMIVWHKRVKRDTTCSNSCVIAFLALRFRSSVVPLELHDSTFYNGTQKSKSLPNGFRIATLSAASFLGADADTAAAACATSCGCVGLWHGIMVSIWSFPFSWWHCRKQSSWLLEPMRLVASLRKPVLDCLYRLWSGDCATKVANAPNAPCYRLE